MSNARSPGRSSAASTPPSPRLQDTVRLSADGLAKVLGDLEARVLRTVWDLRVPVPARAVYERVAEEHAVAPLTVITVLNKLVDKDVLERHKEHDLYHYSARMSEAEFVAHASRRVVEGILSFQPEAVAASMVDVLAERDPEHLAELARLIRRRMKEAGEVQAEAPAEAPASPRAGSSRLRRKT
jgi:predicted transcriptional regulator